MKNLLVVAAIFVFSLSNAAGQAKVFTNDPLTGLPLIPATVLFKNVGNEPDKMPDGQVCKSKMQGEFYSLSTVMNPGSAIKMDVATAWYASHLSGFKKIQGYESGRPQVAFYKSDGTIVIFLTGQLGAQGETPAHFPLPMNVTSPAFPKKRLQV
jgi:hypothetical protein